MWDNLCSAWEHVCAKNGCAGSDGETIDDFNRNIFSSLMKLRCEVLENRYQAQALLWVWLEKPGKKPRPLAIPAVRDRVLQSAANQIMQPFLEEEFEQCSFAYRKGRSVNTAIDQIVKYRDQGYQWVVDADIQQFFNEINHATLFHLVHRLFANHDLLALIKIWIQAQINHPEGAFCLIRGIPQGAPISPNLANLFLDGFDEFLLGKNMKLVRYADDFLILSKSEYGAKQGLELTEKVLKQLKLELNREKTTITNFNKGFRFLGVQFVRSLALKTNSSSSEGPKNQATTSDAQAPEQKITNNFGSIDSSINRVNASDATSHRTLYVLEHGRTLSCENGKVLVKFDGEILQEIHAIHLDQILVFSNIMLTTPFINLCLEHHINLVIMSSAGRFFGVLDNINSRSLSLQKQQFQLKDDLTVCRYIAQSIVRGKIKNTRTIVRRYTRKRHLIKANQLVTSLQNHERKLFDVKTMNEVRGYEGIAARHYYTLFTELFAETWGFNGRNRRPPTDPVNALLSYGYTLLYYNVYALLLARGFDPRIGILHEERSGHAALASDLMEEFRPIVIDALVLRSLLNKRFSKDDFVLPERKGQACLLRNPARRRFVHLFENKMSTGILNPHTGKQGDIRHCILTQIDQLKQVLKGQSTEYKPFCIR